MRKTPTRFAKRMANRLAKAVGKANKHVKKQFADVGIKEIAKAAAAGQFRHFDRALMHSAKAEEVREIGPSQTHREHMLLRKRMRESGELAAGYALLRG